MADQRTDAARFRPVDIKAKRAEGKVFITWSDGRQSTYPFAHLRKNCPCAECRTERDRQSKAADASAAMASEGGGLSLNVLARDPGQGGAVLAGIKPVGNYAIQFTWGDGHDTGIYEYGYLRGLDTDEAGETE